MQHINIQNDTYRISQLSEYRTLILDDIKWLPIAHTSTHSFVVSAGTLLSPALFHYFQFPPSIQFLLALGVWPHRCWALFIIFFEALLFAWGRFRLMVLGSCFATALKDLITLSHLVDLGWSERLANREGLFFHFLVALLLPAALSFQLTHIEETWVYTHRFCAPQVSTEKLVVLVADSVAGVLMLRGIVLCLSCVIWVVRIWISQLV